MYINFQITKIKPEHKDLIATFISDNWGSNIVVTKGIIHKVNELCGFISIKDGQIIGLITFDIIDKECEIVTLDSRISNRGLGTQLINRVIKIAKQNKCIRIWSVTTNDNVRAIGFYQKRNFEWVGFYKNAIENSRKMKPEIPEFGNDGIPIKHEIEFEYVLDPSS